MSEKKSFKVAVLGIFTAVTAVLQAMSYFIKIGNFNLSLVLVPIIIAACLYKPSYSAYLGAVFGLMTVIGCLTGADMGGNILLNSNAVMTVITCMLKGTLCGLLCGLTAKALKKKGGLISVVIPAIVAPVVNTGIFVAMMFIFFKDILYSWAGGTNAVTYVITGLVGINFLIELVINMVLAPAMLRIIKAVKKQ